MVGIAALLWLALVTLHRTFARRPWPGQALSIGWLVAYATVGGVTNVIAFLLGLQIFRATNRVSIFISALLLFFLVVRLSRWTAAWPGWWRWGVALAMGALGVVDQVPRAPPQRCGRRSRPA